MRPKLFIVLCVHTEETAGKSSERSGTHFAKIPPFAFVIKTRLRDPNKVAGKPERTHTVPSGN